MPYEVKYIYGIIATDSPPNLGIIGIGGKQEVVTVGSDGLAAVTSEVSLEENNTASHENLMTHARVIEKVAESHTILPMRFGALAESTDAVITFLKANKRELKKLIKTFDGKAEIGITIIWKDMKKIFKELAEENRTIHILKKKRAVQSQQELIHAGELVEAALDEKKALEGAEYLRKLKKEATQYQMGDLKTEDILLNVSFLLKRNHIKVFDEKVEQLSREFADRIEVKYIGPTAPFSFVNLAVHWNGA
ncbi:MAG: GvpL/GvpF family gas vesicle protein [Gammaproteobacteria bacterium]|nr:GvpL/GvpF family gas vesicle protein [Gammaproteobacteria bacterium]